MVKKVNRTEWLAQKRTLDAQKKLRPTVEKLPTVTSVNDGLSKGGRKKRLEKRRRARLTAERQRADLEEARAAERRVLEADELAYRERELESWQWSSPCSSPEPPVSHTWRLLDERTHPPRIWWGGLLLRTAGCVNCGIKAEFSEGAWETTVAVGDGPCVKWAS